VNPCNLWLTLSYEDSYVSGRHGITNSVITLDAAGALIPQHMKLTADAPDCISEVRFTIQNVTTRPGFCENKTAPTIDSPTNNQDFSFNPTNNLTTTNITVTAGKAVTDFYCKDYGGRCELVTEYVSTNGTVLITSTIPIPIDENNNGIADAWEKHWVERNNTENAFYNVAWSLQLFENSGWDRENPYLGWQHDFPYLNLHHSITNWGDGLSVFYEYRGVWVDGGATFTTPRHAPASRTIRNS